MSTTDWTEHFVKAEKALKTSQAHAALHQWYAAQQHLETAMGELWNVSNRFGMKISTDPELRLYKSFGGALYKVDDEG